MGSHALSSALGTLPPLESGAFVLGPVFSKNVVRAQVPPCLRHLSTLALLPTEPEVFFAPEHDLAHPGLWCSFSGFLSPVS